jgi:predicted RNA binding protein YcfA (HicA-like mRNA interferase family)
MAETNRAAVVRRLGREGWVCEHGGRHDKFTHPDHPAVIIIVPRHRTLSSGVARAMARQAGWKD